MSIHYSAGAGGVSSATPRCATEDHGDPETTSLPPNNFRFSVFIDGTGNNLFNTRYRERTDHTRGDADHRGSYENSFSNVARLATGLQVSSTEFNYHIPIYVEGMGTLHSSPDDSVGMAFGAGRRGVIDRVNSCIGRICSVIISSCDGNRRIQDLKIDAFGFSRGAAAARFLVHRVLESDPPPPGTHGDGEPTYCLIDDLTQNRGFSISNHKMPFIGLYDTVGSYRAYANPLASIENDTEELKLDAVGLGPVEKVVQLAAADEHRMNFPLTNINSAVNAGKGTQIFLPGAHSDVGGGYNDSSDRREEGLVVFDFFSTSLVSTADIRTRCNEVRDNLITLGWYNDAVIELAPDIPVHELDVSSTELKVRANRINISNRYSRVPLRIMAEKAGEKQLTFDLDEYPISDDPFLGEVKSRIENNSYSDQQWMTSHDTQLKRLRHDYCHFSSHFTPSEFVWGLISVWPMKPQMYSSRDQWDDSAHNSLHGIRRRRIHDG